MPHFSVTTKKAGKTYFLHIKRTPTSTGKDRTVFYFSSEQKGSEEKIPDGYTVVESEKTGLPFLKKAS